MKYFLDFDRTIYNTDAFKRALARRPTVFELLQQGKAAGAEWMSPGASTRRRDVFAQALGTFLSHGRLFFRPEELRTFLYPDAEIFIQSHDCTIVTYGVRAFIAAKVTAAITHLNISDVVYTARKKGPTIRRLSLNVTDECTFIDDMPFQLDSVATWCPDVHVIEIRRDGKPGSGRWRVIQSLEEINHGGASLAK